MDYNGKMIHYKRKCAEYTRALERRKKQIISFNKILQDLYHLNPEIYNKVYHRFEG